MSESVVTPRGVGRLLKAVVLPAALAACTTAEQFNPPVTAFVTASEKMATSIRSDNLPSYRRSLRQDLVTADLVDLSRGPWSESVRQRKAGRVPVAWLCWPTYQYDAIAQPLSVIDARNKVLTDRVKAPGDDIGTLLEALGKAYEIPAEKEAAPEAASYSAWIANAGKECAAMVNRGNPYVTRPETDVEFIAEIGTAIALIEVFWTVAKPVVVGTLKTIDMERKAAALRAYFSDDRNVAIMKKQFLALEYYVEVELTREQTKAAGVAAAAALTLYDFRAAHWTKMNAVASSATCSGMATEAPYSLRRKACMDGLLEPAAKPLTVALDAADKFDGVMAKRLPKQEDRLSAKVEILRKIALGQQATEDELKGLWATALRYIALFQSVGEATSDANQKKVVDSWNTLKKALNL